MKNSFKVIIGGVVFLLLANFYATNSSKSSPLQVADSYLQDIADELKVRNEASAPLAEAVTQSFSGEITPSQFIGKYPKLLNDAQAGSAGVKKLCTNPPSIADSSSSETKAAIAMLDLAESFCKSEDLKWLYVTKAIEAASTLDQATFDRAMTLLDNYGTYMYTALTKFTENEAIKSEIPSEQLTQFNELASTYKP